jgi:hypothetical protein
MDHSVVRIPTCACVGMPRDDLAAFAAELKSRLERDELAGHPPIQLDAALTLTDVEKAARAMLAEAESYRSMAEPEHSAPHHLARRRELARQLRLFRDRLAGIPFAEDDARRPLTY